MKEKIPNIKVVSVSRHCYIIGTKAIKVVTIINIVWNHDVGKKIRREG